MSSWTITPRVDAAPSPRQEVFLDGLDTSVASITMYRTAAGRTFKVRGAVSAAVSSGHQVLDVEAPFQVPASYRAEMFDSSGNSLGFTGNGNAGILNVSSSWVHNPLDPAGAVEIDIEDTSARSLVRPTPGERFNPERRSLGMLISGRRRGLEGVDMFLSTDRPDVAEKFEAMIGGYEDDDQQVPVLCFRTPGFTDLPPTFYASVLSPKRKPITVHMGGTLREWEATVDETAPPFAGIVIPLLTRDDIDAAFATRNALDAYYTSRLAIDRDYSKAGTA